MSTPDLAKPQNMPRFYDLLHAPLIGRFLRWRWSRLLVQLFFLAVAALIIYDGFTGPQLAPTNTATVLAWVHYRGLVLLGFLLVGNLFCFGCPFTIPRSLAKRLSLAGNRWPRLLRRKWIAAGTLVLFFWLYELFDLWASPLLTAWIVIAYFVGTFLLEALFRESPFCKYICPLGTFNFVHSTISPFQISAADLSTCKSCKGKECINGSESVLGCGTELYVPTLQSNLDCTLCLDCARACPYDNVVLKARPPLHEFSRHTIPARWDMHFLIGSLAILSLVNALGMVPPINEIQRWMNNSLGIESEVLRLSLVFILSGIVLPGILISVAAWLSSRPQINPMNESPKLIASRYIPALVPVSLAIWTAHFGFHFVIGGLTLLPVSHAFLLNHGISIFGYNPNWDVGFLLPESWIFPIQVGLLFVGLIGGFIILTRQAIRDQLSPIHGYLQLLPWAGIILLLVMSALSLFNLPMEMRGTFMIGGT